MSVRLFVGNLPYDVTEPDLREYFSQAGAVSYVSIPVDRETGKRRGFAFVEFSDSAQAEEAIRKFNNQNFRGRQIAVNEARARENRPRPAGGAAPRPSFSHGDSPRPSSSAPFTSDVPQPPAREWRSRKQFGPDAKPARNRGLKARKTTELKRKGPIRERRGGQFFGEDEEDFFNNNNNNSDPETEDFGRFLREDGSETEDLDTEDQE